MSASNPIPLEVVAAALGADVGAVTMQLGDTDVAPYGMGSRGARGATAGGSALTLAARELKVKVLAIAAAMLGFNSADGLEMRDGRLVRVIGGVSDETGIGLADGARRAHFDPLALPAGMEPGLMAVKAYDPPPLTFSNSAHGCVVEIDRETGTVEILRYVAAEDAGQVINPIIVEGQTAGAVAMGLSGALMERAAYAEGGQLLGGSLMDYALARAEDLPAFELIRMDRPSPLTPAGIKGMAEGGALGAVGALMNAVNDALAQAGARLASQPANPERIWRALRGEASPR
ncbi:MAG: xanthine dehydrogenase family protein molybdopterin-binding subunit [Acetobacteraceae bacterium]